VHIKKISFEGDQSEERQATRKMQFVLLIQYVLAVAKCRHLRDKCFINIAEYLFISICIQFDCQISSWHKLGILSSSLETKQIIITRSGPKEEIRSIAPVNNILVSK